MTSIKNSSSLQVPKMKSEQTLNTENVSEHAIGKRQGLTSFEIQELAGRLQSIHVELELKLKDDQALRNEYMAWLKLGDQEEDHLNLIDAYAREVKERYQFFVIVGIGGSSLGAKAVLHALNYLGDKTDIPEIVFLEN